MRKIFLTILPVLMFSAQIFSQSTDQKTNDLSPSGLALQVNFIKDRPPAFHSYSETDLRFSSAWYSLFGRIPNFKPAADSLPVRAVNIVPTLDKNSVKVTVSVFTGQKFHDKEELVGVYSLKENEKFIVKDLTKFGVEPFEIMLVRLTPTAAVLPTFRNNTNSFQLISIEPVVSTLPKFKVKLLNASEKAVIACTFAILVDEKLNLSGMPQGKHGEPLVKAGGTYETIVPGASQNTKLPDGAAPSAPPNQTFVIKTVIFEDGSYEGNESEAAMFIGFVIGRKIALKQIINFLEKSSPENLAVQFENLQISVDDNSFNYLLKRFSNINARGSIEIAANGVKREFQQEYDKVKNRTPEEQRLWINTIKNEYKQWFARLP